MDPAQPDGWTAPGSESPRLAELCRSVFESLPRGDQRRWAEVYVRGLVSVPGRKSLRRISENVVGHSVEQALQQFVNQSPWPWEPVRHVLAMAMGRVIPIQAWVLQETEFVKDGRSSVGVEGQYLPGAGRSVNCQLALATWVAGAGGSVPVNWRLMLPASWDADVERRSKAHLPDSERHRDYAQYALESVDEMIGSWDLPIRPVVADRRHDRALEPLVRGLEERGLAYALRISDRTTVVAGTRTRAPLSAGEMIHAATRRMIPVLPATGRGPGPRGSSMVVAEAVVPVAPVAARTGADRSRARRVVARWPHGRGRPGQLWLTNLGTAQMTDLLDIADIAERTAGELAALRSESGLDHFEGRSYRGWHHHVTLASAAHAHRTLEKHLGSLPATLRALP